MSTKERIEGNKLIAEFLGSKFINNAPKDYPHGYYYQPEGMESDCPTGLPEDWLFDSDWNWTMSVVERIETLLAEVEIRNNQTRIIGYNTEIVRYHPSSKILAVYLAVVDFVKWYNYKQTQTK